MVKIYHINIPRFLIVLGLLTLSFIYLFVKLAIWQFDRSEEKRIILQKIFENNHVSEIFSINELEAKSEYSKISISGHFDNSKPMFLSSQFYNHKPGYQVIIPFIISDQSVNTIESPGIYKTNQQNLNNQTKQAVLVNCGWLDNPKNYKSSAITKCIKNEKIIGIVKKSNKNQYIMGNNLSQINNNIHIQKINTSDQDIIKLYSNNYHIASNYLRLISPNQGYITNWIWTNISPQKHFVYAIQWLLLAITTFLLYSCLCYKTLRP